jgi:molybdenum cofactor cytidylyltransferase
MEAVRSYAVVPAAGMSARMGRHKLLLPWGERSVIEQVLGAWLASAVDRVVVVVRAYDGELLARCRAMPVDVVEASVAPPDMKASIQLALSHIRTRYSPAPNDAWLLAPADLPRLTAGAIDAVLAAYEPEQPTPMAPSFDGERGHPVLLPWSYAADVARLPVGEGVNSLLKGAPVREIAWQDDSIMRDVDTPLDYARALHRNAHS